MGRLNFNNYTEQPAEQEVEFKGVAFSPFKDKDATEAVVRFFYDNTDQFDLEVAHTVHVPTSSGKVAYKKVSCLREAKDPISNCPFCASSDEDISKVSTRFFCKGIAYNMEDGKMVASPFVWDRPASFAKKLADMLSMYGDLTKVVFRITRTGKGLETRYSDPMYCPKEIYKDEIYVPDFSGLDSFDLYRVHCLKKSAEEMSTFLATGAFPEVNNNTQPKGNTFTPSVQLVAAEIAPDFAYENTAQQFYSASTTAAPQPAVPPMAPVSGAPQTSRPPRTYAK